MGWVESKLVVCMARSLKAPVVTERHNYYVISLMRRDVSGSSGHGVAVPRRVKPVFEPEVT